MHSLSDSIFLFGLNDNFIQKTLTFNEPNVFFPVGVEGNMQKGWIVSMSIIRAAASNKMPMRHSCAVTAQLISAFVFATRIVPFLFYLNPSFQASSLLRDCTRDCTCRFVLDLVETQIEGFLTHSLIYIFQLIRMRQMSKISVG